MCVRACTCVCWYDFRYKNMFRLECNLVLVLTFHLLAHGLVGILFIVPPILHKYLGLHILNGRAGFMRVLGIWTEVLTLAQQTFYPLSHFPSSKFTKYMRFKNARYICIYQCILIHLHSSWYMYLLTSIYRVLRCVYFLKHLSFLYVKNVQNTSFHPLEIYNKFYSISLLYWMITQQNFLLLSNCKLELIEQTLPIPFPTHLPHITVSVYEINVFRFHI